MNFKITASKLTGIPDQKGWVISSDFTPSANDIFLKKGRLLTVVSMLAKNGTSLPQDENLIVGREILTRLHEEYFAQAPAEALAKEGNQFALLQKAVEKIKTDFSSPNEDIQILCACFLENKIILSGIGEVEAWINRRSNLAKLISENTASKAIAGPLVDGDIFYMGTLNMFQKVTPELLKEENPFSNFKDLDSLSGVLTIKIIEEKVINQVAAPKIESAPTPINPFPKKISPIRIAIASLIDKVLLILPTERKVIKPDLINPQNSKKKLATRVGAVLLLLLIISIGFGTRQKKIKDVKSQYEPILSSIKHDLDEGKSLSAADLPQARDLILSAKNELDKLKSQKISDPRIADLDSQIKDALGSTAGIYIDDPKLYLDLSLQTSGFTGSDMSLSDSRLVVLDTSGKRLISIDVGTKKTQTVAGPDIMPNAIGVSAYADRNFVTSNNGVWEIGDKADVVIKKDWGQNILAKAYTGNFYILDKDNDKLWRFQGDGGVFSGKQSWFPDSFSPDLQNVIAWTIDGNIWALTKDNNILRFANSSPVNFSLKDMDKDPQAIDIYTNEDSKYLYLLDKGNSRVLVINKDGTYKGQYLSDNIKEATKLVVSEESQKIILLEGPNLYSLDLKNL